MTGNARASIGENNNKYSVSRFFCNRQTQEMTIGHFYRQMPKLSYPISQSEAGIALVSLPKSIYEPEAIRQTAYKFSGQYHIIAQDKGNYIDITFESKTDTPISEKQIKDICNDFIDQQVRIDTEKQFGHIRDLIVEEAFNPINKSK